MDITQDVYARQARKDAERYARLAAQSEAEMHRLTARRSLGADDIRRLELHREDAILYALLAERFDAWANWVPSSSEQRGAASAVRATG